MIILFLNDMRSSHYEDRQPAARGETMEEIARLLEAEAVEPYATPGLSHDWGKTYREGGPLEWYNPPMGDLAEYVEDIGSLEDWRARAEAQWACLLALPTVAP